MIQLVFDAVNVSDDVGMSFIELTLLPRRDVVAPVALFNFDSVRAIGKEDVVSEAGHLVLVATHGAYGDRIFRYLVLELVGHGDGATGGGRHVKLVNYKKQGLPHVQVVLLFDVLDGAHGDMLFTEERPEHLAVEQTFTGTGYAA